MKVCYRPKKFQQKTLALIDLANEIIEDYAAQGYRLTLRQLYYQFVTRNALSNSEASYKKLSAILSDARYAGLVDWDAIEDRGRPLHTQSHWSTPGDILRAAAGSYARDKWDGQDYRPEVWIEKEALIGVVAPTCDELDLSYFACKGYSSSSTMYEAARRMRAYRGHGQYPVILHLGDHDPSGEDMTRDIICRMETFGVDVEVARLALNMEQVREYNLPPNPAKTTDARSRGYIDRHGDGSWELDALSTDVIVGLIQEAVDGLMDDDLWRQAEHQQEEERQRLLDLSENWKDT